MQRFECTATLVGLMHRNETLGLWRGPAFRSLLLCCGLQKDPCDATFGKAKKVTAVMFADIGDRHERHTRCTIKAVTQAIAQPDSYVLM